MYLMINNYALIKKLHRTIAEWQPIHKFNYIQYRLHYLRCLSVNIFYSNNKQTTASILQLNLHILNQDKRLSNAIPFCSLLAPITWLAFGQCAIGLTEFLYTGVEFSTVDMSFVEGLSLSLSFDVNSTIGHARSKQPNDTTTQQQ